MIEKLIEVHIKRIIPKSKYSGIIKIENYAVEYSLIYKTPKTDDNKENPVFILDPYKTFEKFDANVKNLLCRMVEDGIDEYESEISEIEMSAKDFGLFISGGSSGTVSNHWPILPKHYLYPVGKKATMNIVSRLQMPESLEHIFKVKIV